MKVNHRAQLAISHPLARPLVVLWVLIFAIIGAKVIFFSKATGVTIDTSLPQPVGVQVFGDDRVATVTWSAPVTALQSKIVGYYVTWGEKSTALLPNVKQTTFTTTQIEPLENGKEYTVSVQAIQGTVASKTIGGGVSAREAQGNGSVSAPIFATVTPSSARVDALRSSMTAFFDDFNLSSSSLNQLKWNIATSSCAKPGSNGAYQSSQMHARTTIASRCEQAQISARPRAVFDIAGTTEEKPGIITFDVDGATRNRDMWFLDLIPLSARTSGVPMDITSHHSAFDDVAEDPGSMLRMTQRGNAGQTVDFKYYADNKVARSLIPITACSATAGGASQLSNCTAQQSPDAPKLSPLFDPSPLVINNQFLIPNVKRHWVFEISPVKIKLFIDSIKVWEGATPPEMAANSSFAINSTLFSNNTGTGDLDHPTMSILNWDNFGFNGPAPSLVVHSYPEGGVSGILPYVGTGTTANPIPDSPRATKINVPDPIAGSNEARLMFTLSTYGANNYAWQASDNITINGHAYPLPDPTTVVRPPIIQAIYGPSIGDQDAPYADSIKVNLADLKQGVNDVAINIRASNILNVHLELDYAADKPSVYTQPIQTYGNAYTAFSVPTITAHDSYLFIEQNMGLPVVNDAPIPKSTAQPVPVVVPNPTSAVVPVTPSSTPVANTDTIPPTVALTTPLATAKISGKSYTVTADANDNVAVSKVEFYLNNNLLGTDTTRPYTFTLDTTLYTNGSYQIMVKAYDAAGTSASTTPVNVIIDNTAIIDTTKPVINITSLYPNINTFGPMTISIGAEDTNGLRELKVFVDGSLTGTITNPPANYLTPFTAFVPIGGGAELQPTTAIVTQPFVFNIPGTDIPAGHHEISVIGVDGFGNAGQSTVNINQLAVAPGTGGSGGSGSSGGAGAGGAPSKIGDFNGDGKVNIVDLGILLGKFRKSVLAFKTGDCNGDGKVDIADLGIFLGKYGK